MRRVLLIGYLVFLAAPALAADNCPAFPARGVEVIDRLWNAPQANGNDDARRDLTRTILEQLAYDFPADGWTWKAADRTRPPSKDALARLVGGRLCAWDWQNGTTRKRAVQVGQRGEDITGQHPIPVARVDHLGGATTPPAAGPTVDDLQALAARLDSLAARLEDVQRTVAAHAAHLAEPDRVAPLAERVEGLATDLQYAAQRIGELAARPVVVGCSAAINLGIGSAPIRCRLVTGE